MSTINYLLWAYEEKIKTQGSGYRIEEDDSFFGSVYRDTADEIDSWLYGVRYLVDIGNWQLQRLFQEDGYMRRPKAYLCVELTSKRNFVLNWYPEMPVRHSMEETDWLYWDDIWGPNSRPFNRILMIHGLDYYIYRQPDKAFDKAEEYLLRAVYSLLRDIYNFLSQVIDIEVIDDFYLEYDETKPPVNRRLTGCGISTVKEVERERREQKRKLWLQGTFESELGISPEYFLNAFKSSALKYAPTAKMLSDKIKKHAKLSPARVKSLSVRLFNEYPEIYRKVLAQPPKGLEAKSKVGQILHIDFTKKREK